ncbi:hypothetical protein NEFER03_0619 [Nematocida sp. LUAm3]|nr:hypothetical protein NEFER03_0619 [Nematocida sp. LUAm3]KAI5175586.1 hypothetical protein NEFER02_1492 [Nematocida sp. LUAm2]KAI5178384.1 hypothetical protein NEFER01_1531 [Nematocida sp. LUAm1]
MSEEQKKHHFIRKETIFHLVLIVAALMGVAYSIRQLQIRKEEAKNELVKKFNSSFSQVIAYPIFTNSLEPLTEESLKKEYISLDLNYLSAYFPTKFLFNLPSVVDYKVTEENAQKIFDDTLDVLHNGKLENPFLFGFKDIGDLLVDAVGSCLSKEYPVNIKPAYAEIIKNIERYFSGQFAPREYKLICDIFIYIIYTISNEKTKETIGHYDESDQTLHILSYEYLVAAAMINEVSTSILGKRITMEEFLKRYNLDGSYLNESSLLGAVNQRTLHFSKQNNILLLLNANYMEITFPKAN